MPVESPIVASLLWSSGLPRYQVELVVDSLTQYWNRATEWGTSSSAMCISAGLKRPSLPGWLDERSGRLGGANDRVAAHVALPS